MQRRMPLGESLAMRSADPDQTLALLHDGTEAMRRMVRRVVDQSVDVVRRRLTSGGSAAAAQHVFEFALGAMAFGGTNTPGTPFTNHAPAIYT